MQLSTMYPPWFHSHDFIRTCCEMPPFASRLHDLPPVDGCTFIGGHLHDLTCAVVPDGVCGYQRVNLYTILGSRVAIMIPQAFTLKTHLVPMLRVSKYATAFGCDTPMLQPL